MHCCGIFCSPQEVGTQVKYAAIYRRRRGYPIASSRSGYNGFVSCLNQPAKEAQLAEKIRPQQGKCLLPQDVAKAEKAGCICRHKPASFAVANGMAGRYIRFYHDERIQYQSGVAQLMLRHSC